MNARALMCALGLVAGLLPLTSGCQAAPARGRAIVLALDGVDPDAVDLLAGEGKLPVFSRLKQQGASGRLRSSRPLLSPVVWTTIATGRTPLDHRITDFTAVDRARGEVVPVTSRMRKVKALWNIVSDRGGTAGVVGWWATWPAESIQGTIVSDRLCYHFLFGGGFRDAGEKAGLVSPAGRFESLSPLVRRPDDISRAELGSFLEGPVPDSAATFDFRDDLSHFRWALATAESYAAIGLRLWDEDSPDLLMVYIEAADTASHLYGHLFRAGEVAGALEEQRRRHGGTVERVYQHLDRIVGRFLERLDERTTLVVLSDHGFALGALPDNPARVRDLRRVSAENHRIDGVLYLYGRGVRPGAPIENAGILDVAPTLLALLGQPASGQMPGRVVAGPLSMTPPPRVATFEEEPAGPGEHAGGSSVDPEVIEKLRSLGYVGADSPRGDRTLAAIMLEEGRYEQAAQAYRALLRERPDDAGLLAGLGAALGGLGRYDEARGHLERAVQIQPLLSEAHHNLAVLHERLGERDAAIHGYRQALRYSPGHGPSLEALQRLTGGAGPPDAHLSPLQQVAMQMAEQAADLARRGDFAGAMRRLDDAARIAPELALVHQYRSNVAWLMGDHRAAIEALEAGLQIEPDNALFKENLRRLGRASKAGR